MIRDLLVELGERSYPVITFPHGVEELAALLHERALPGRLLLVSDENVQAVAGDALRDELGRLGRVVRSFVVPAGETSKSTQVLVRLWDEALNGGVERSDTVIALGGGVVGDLGGFLASTLLRGIHLIHVATSVLAMSDASIGGKTGINVAAGKNLVGSFYQPRAVIQWTGALGTLSERERRSGLAEVIKSALIAGESELRWLEDHAEALAAGELGAMSEAVHLAAGLKAKIVSADEREGGVRRLLNLGHTLGHVIEHATGYGTWTHGEAVSAGMVLALELGISRGIGSVELKDRLLEILRAQKLPTAPPSLSMDQWTGPLAIDKKRSGQAILFVFCYGPGDCRAEPVPLVDLVAWLNRLC